MAAWAPQPSKVHSIIDLLQRGTSSDPSAIASASTVSKAEPFVQTAHQWGVEALLR